jgi:hypothetical protein
MTVTIITPCAHVQSSIDAAILATFLWCAKRWREMLLFGAEQLSETGV